MTWMRGLLEKVRARLHAEHGFSLLETVIAITVIFASLLALSYTATVGFGYESLARQRQSATALANGTMEQARGLAYAKIQTGMRTGDLAGDPNVVTGCAGDPAGTYRFLSCSPGTVPGSGEKIVHSPTATNAAPLVPHATTVTQNGITFTIRTYVTNNCTTVDGIVCTALTPYRVTVIVTWTGGRSYPTKLVRLQSLFYSPTGCRSMETHPFAAPCQPFFFGTASIPRGEVHIEGSVHNTSFQSGDVFTPALDSQVQHEQMTQAQAGYTPTGVQIVDGSETRTAGGTTQVTAAADTDPGSPSTTLYATSSYTGPSSSTLSSGGENSLTLTSPAGDSARADATTRAGVAYVCPPPPDTNESDGRPCAGARIQQGGDLIATLTLGDGVGTATLARIAAASEPSKTFVDHVLYNESSTMLPGIAGCAPVSGADGCLEQSAVRRFGTINLGGLPSSVPGPANWSGTNAWNGYLVSIVGYADQVAAPVGRQVLSSSGSGTAVPAPSARVTAGTVYYWNPATGSYASLAATSDSLVAALQASTMTATATVSGRTVTVTISVQAGSVTKATTGTSTTVGGTGNLSRTEASAQATPPKLSLRYQVWVNGSQRADLTIAVNLKTMEARGVYAPPPLSGS
jgi:type II secretory pathway pseudopilin PulG